MDLGRSGSPDPHGRRPAPIDSQSLERELLRQGVGALGAERHTCADCGRTPLIGEHIHVYERGELVCELCSALRREDPVSSEAVRHSEYGHAVRVTRAA
jgi:hypothetical protein